MNPRSWFGDLTGYFVYILFIATLGPLLFGFHLSELNAPEDVIRCKKRSITSTDLTATATPNLPQCIEMTPTQWGVVGSMYTLGGLIGALSAAPLAGKYGRLRAMQITTLFFTIGPVFEAFSPSIAVLAFGRLVSGVGAGAAVVIVPLYISEIAPPANKGFFGAFTQIMCNVGILVTQLLGYFLSHDSYWRVILAVGGIIGLAQGLGLLLSAESPKYLAEKGNLTQAKRTLRKIRGADADIDAEMSDWGVDGSNVSGKLHYQYWEEEQTLLNNEGGSLQSATKDKEGSLTITQVFRHPDYKKAAIAVIMVMLAQQFSGINSIVMYGVSLLAGLLESNSALLNLAVSAINIVITAGGAPLPDKFGRKPCLLGSIAGMGISALLLAIGIMKSVPVLSALAVLFFVSSFALGLGPVPFILASELVGPEAVDATQSIALGANWIATFIVAQFFPLLSAQLGGKVYLIFAALSVFFFGFLSWYVPETKGKKNADEVWGRERRVD
ncbi:Bifunctional purine biosynthesis protein PurH [Nothophoma quercina]|uniref:Bifunctional purine biosynthesis protein PurH n=1 Tax=Nothophoma quercina TaxID=749835 RepID=A0ABR3R9V8_9PLEO